MDEHKLLYRWPLEYAILHGEQTLWRESRQENCSCARAIEQSIWHHYHDNRLESCAKSVIGQYGFDRVNWVLANTIQQNSHDGRFSAANRQWAQEYYFPKDDDNWRFAVTSHPGLTDLFTNQVRDAWKELGLFDASHCLPDDHQQDYTDKVVVMDPRILKDQYKTPEDQLFLAEGGFGATPYTRGRMVLGTFLKDGVTTYFAREDIIGVLKEEYLPEWAREKLEQIRAQETPGITMGGM